MEIRDIKEQLSIVTVLEHYGIKPNKNKMVCCPFHDDKNPSMQVYPGTNTVHCFSGNCKLTGKAIDQIDFILYKESCTKHEAIKKAESLISPTLQPTVIKPLQQSENLTEIFSKLKSTLYSSGKGRAYAESRNIYNVKLEAGYNNGTHYKHLKNCLVFPLKDKSGNIVSLYGRNIESKGNEDRHFYLQGRSGLYPGYPDASTTSIVITESIIDAATLQLYTTHKVLSLYGTNGLNEEHKAALKALPQLKEIIFFLNGDEAGKEATAKHSKALHEQFPGVIISQVNVPEEEDVNSLVQSHEPEILNHLIAERTKLFPSVEEKKQKQQPLPSQPITNGRLNTTNPDYIAYTRDNILISVIGGIALYPLDKLKVTLKAERSDSRSPLHSIRQSNLDLYSDEQAERFTRRASEKLETGSKAMQICMAELTGLLEEYRAQKIEEQKPKKAEKRILTESRKAKAISFLKRKQLLKRTNEVIGLTGVVGEEKNRLLMFLVFTSRLREQPLHIISLGASGTGKTYLQEKVAELIPEEEKLEITTLSENALYYFDRKELQHKLVLIEDLDGAQDDKILYAIRELMSKKRISKTIPIKDSKGNLKTVTITVEGPISLAGTTTREKLYEDNANRSLLLYLDNSAAHRNAIMEYQRKLSAGIINKGEEEQARELLQDIQSILQPVRVRNPFATQLCIPETVFKPLRTNTHYLAFIETITFYHQYQREIKTDPATQERYIETTLEDIQAANILLKEVLLAKSDELTNACRSFLETLKTLLQKEKKTSFFKHEVREHLRINPHNLKYYLSQLLQYGYIKVIGGNPYKQGYEYEITSKEEYAQLNSSIQTALDKALENIKAKVEQRMRLTVANEIN
jgi:DNA primase